MNTTYRVVLLDGTHLDALTLSAADAVVRSNPGADCRPVVHYRPCAAHRGYEAGNCPACQAPERPVR